MFRRQTRRLAAFFVVFALLFSQLALASYVCPLQPVQDASAGAMEMTPGMPCEGMGQASDEQGPTVICHQHCSNSPQSFDPLDAPAATPPAVVQPLVIALVLVDSSLEVRAHADTPETRPPPDPLFLSTLRLRV